MNLTLRSFLPLFGLSTLLSTAGIAQQSTDRLATSAATSTAAASADTEPTALPGTLVFKLRPEYAAQASADRVAVPAVEAVLRRFGATRLTQKFPHTALPDPEKPGSVNLRLVYQVWFGPEVVLDKVRFALKQTGALEYAEPLYYRAPLVQPNDPLADSTNTAGQYHLKKIAAYRAWNLTQGDTTIVIGITDTGFNLAHEDLAGQWQRNYQDPPDGIDNDNDGYVDNYRGWDFADRDNNPAPDATVQPFHGVLTTGAAAARANNGLGGAGVGFKCRFLPLKIYASTPGGSFAGYEAVVYAADHGCKVVNLSWGGPGGRSQFEQDAIAYAAVNRDVVVVASAGNTNAELDFYPASYDYVLSVGASNATDGKAGFATYSRRLDLLAPGENVLTTWGTTNNNYVGVSGSSFSAPLAAGAAALVRSRFPQLNASQVIAQLRRTTDNVDTLAANAAYVSKLGTGRLNVYRAVLANNQHAARITQRTISPVKQAYQPGDTLRLAVEVQNLLQPTQNLRLTVTSLSPYLVVQQGTFAVGPMATLARASNTTAPFRVAVAANVPLNTKVTLRYRFTDTATGYTEDFYSTLLLHPGFVTLNAGNLSLTLTSRGSLGYDGLGSTLGDGVSYRGGAPLMYEGGLLLGTGTGRVSDRLRKTYNTADADFYCQSKTALQSQMLRADQQASGMFRDSLPSATRGRTVGVQVRQRGFAWSTAPHRDYVVLEYQLKNATVDTLKPLYAGLFADWDVAPQYSRNVVVWDSVRNMSYVYDLYDPTTYVGIKWLQGGRSTCYALDMYASSGPIRMSDGFSTAEKFTTLSSGTTHRTTGQPYGTDIAHVVGAALPRLAPADSAVVAFAILAAPSLAQLRAAADAAQSRYTQVLPTRTPAATVSADLYPNPTSGRLRVSVPANFGLREVQVLNLTGQQVAQHPCTGTTTDLDLHELPQGVYLVRGVGQSGEFVRRVLVRP